MIETTRTSENNIECECPSIEIAAFIDGELSSEAEAKLEAHLETCSVCTQELNDQKNFVNALNISLNDLPEIPADFTKRVVTNAESGVSGLRKSRERLNAFLVCCVLFLFILFTLGASASRTIAVSLDVFGRLAAVLGFAIHLGYDIAIGAVVIMRTIAGQPAFPPIAVAIILPTVIFIAYKYSFVRFGRGGSEQLESGSRS